VLYSYGDALTGETIDEKFRCFQKEDVAAVSFAVGCCRNPTQEKKGCRER
jgi:hypothetical protein